MEMTERDLKLRHCMNAFTGHGELPELKTEALKPVGKSYERNIKRVYALVLFPPAAVWITMTAQRCTDNIEHKFPKMEKNRRLALIEADIKKQIQRETSIIEQGGPLAEQLIEQQHKVSFHILSEQGNADFRDGPEAWMASQIIATWTAFEAMAGDLWEAALNTKPAILAKLSGRNPSKSKSSDDPRRIRLDHLYRYNFDLSERMGSIFVEDKRYSFDRLDGIREAYLDAFSVDGREIEKIITNEILEVSSLVRNNLVHNGGIIDALYLKRASILPPEALGEVGDPILIDGELVAKINGPMIKAGHDLVVAVDNWLASQ
jgi:hypothetical protein